jgi:hypothetical protein
MPGKLLSLPYQFDDSFVPALHALSLSSFEESLQRYSERLSLMLLDKARKYILFYGSRLLHVAVGVTSNGADGATLSSSLAMPTTAKTLIRHVLELPLPKEGSVRMVGIDEWAWKKGSHYGTILVDLERRRVTALLPEREVSSSTAWFKKHPEVEIVSRDRGKIFRAAASAGAPQAKQIVDRFHLQKNCGEALEKFFSHRKRLLKKVAHQLGGKTPLPPKTPALKAIEQERERRHAQRVIRHKKR